MRSRFSWAALFTALVTAGCGSGGGGSSGAIGTGSGAAGAGSPTLAVSGGIVESNAVQPLLFAWGSAVTVTGDRFLPGDVALVSLYGPLNSIGVVPGLRPLGGFTADASGHFSGSLVIPYDGGVTGPGTRIPRPGAYEVEASSRQSVTVSASDVICLCPETDATVVDWGHERGGRDGFFPGAWRDLSPERVDPEWVSAWDERPVGAYGSVEDAHISASDYPGRHYGHDSGFSLHPDDGYRWIIGTENFHGEGGGVEVEWETLNGGTTAAYGTGTIGLPLWAAPTDGDRVYVVGRWILDTGHPGGGSSTEIHPPRLLATMRARPTLNAAGAPAAQVDVYVSGHGGGADRVPYGLSAALAFADGRGGGRIQDLGNAVAATYYQPGPANVAEKIALSAFGAAMGLSASDLVKFLRDVAALPSAAGPSAFGWPPDWSEEQPIDDMDYEFDVPLPPQPTGTASIQVEVDRHTEDTTAVNEVISYPDFPRSAHVRLPYTGMGRGIYARTLKLAWSPSGPAPAHFRVRIVEIDVVDLPGQWQVFADVSGQWLDLGSATPAFGQVVTGQAVNVGADLDVYLGATDRLSVMVMGYRAAPLDALFGQLFDLPAYGQAMSLAAVGGITGTRDNDSLGEAALELKPPLPIAPATFTVAAVNGTGPGHLQMKVLVEPK